MIQVFDDANPRVNPGNFRPRTSPLSPRKQIGNTVYLRFSSVDAYDVQPRHDLKSSVVAQNGDSSGAVLI